MDYKVNTYVEVDIQELFDDLGDTAKQRFIEDNLVYADIDALIGYLSDEGYELKNTGEDE